MALPSGVIRPYDDSTLMSTQNADAVQITGGTVDSVAIDGGMYTVATTATPATGTCACQFVFKDANGVALAHAVSGLLYYSNSTGLAIGAATSAAVLTNGALTELVAGKVDHFVTTATGLLGITVTAPTGTYYATFVLPSGRIITSSALGVN